MRKYDVKNKDFASTDKVFQTACELAGLKVTTRQGSKWRNEKGKAFAFRFDARSKLEQEKGEK